MLATGNYCLLAVLVASALSSSNSAAAEDAPGSLVDVISSHDQARLRQLLVGAQPYTSVATAFQIVSGLGALGFQDGDKITLDSACTYAQASVDKSSLESVFYVTSTIKKLGSACKASMDDVKGLLQSALAQEEPSTQTLFYTVTSMSNLGMAIDNTTVLPALLKAVESEESPLSYGRAFLTASLLPDADLSELFDQIEDTVAQADETPSTLYFEEGLVVTSTILTGIFALADRVGDAPTITSSQATKFGNYIISNKYASSVAGAFHVLSTAKALSSNKFVVPSALLLVDRMPISSARPYLKVRLSTLLGGALEGFSVQLTSIEDPDEVTDEKRRTLKAGEDSGTYVDHLYPAVSSPGVYKVSLRTEDKGSSPIADLPSVKLSVTVSYEVTVGSAQLSVVDKDQGVATKTKSLEFPKSGGVLMEADSHYKLLMNFVLLNKATSKSVTVHQAFIRLTLDDMEIFYVATANDNQQYSFELDIAEAAADFGQMSGTYTLALVVGDFSLENPFSWDAGSVVLKFPGTPKEKTGDIMYKPKPEIQHVFRVPDKRPPQVVSTAFTGLVLAPLGVLMVLWFLLGANISNFTTGGLWAMLFHVGLTAIFGLYYLFWIRLNMFQTLKYLAVIGLFTFFTGNRMLRRIAQARQS